MPTIVCSEINLLRTNQEQIPISLSMLITWLSSQKIKEPTQKSGNIFNNTIGLVGAF